MGGLDIVSKSDIHIYLPISVMVQAIGDVSQRKAILTETCRGVRGEYVIRKCP